MDSTKTMITTIRSKLLKGKVMHQRMHPTLHHFVYPVFLLRLDLDELEAQQSMLNSAIFGVNKLRLLSIQTRDYGPRDGTSLKQWAIQLLLSEGIEEVTRIELQTFPRIFNYAFNPISIWYCFNKEGGLSAVLAEVNNTFGDHHFYLLRGESSDSLDGKRLQSSKAMHVSPFCEVKGYYEFKFKDRPQSTLVKIDYYAENAVTIKTAISSKHFEFSTRNLALAIAKQPLLTVGVFWRIHWQALLLWLKAVPYFRLPASSPNRITRGTTVQEEQ